MQDARLPKDGVRRKTPSVHVVVCTGGNDTIMVDGTLPWSFRAACQRTAIDNIVGRTTVILGAVSFSLSFLREHPPSRRSCIESTSQKKRKRVVPLDNKDWRTRIFIFPNREKKGKFDLFSKSYMIGVRMTDK